MKFNQSAAERQAVIDQAIKDNRWKRRYHTYLADVKIELSCVVDDLSSLKDRDKWHQWHQAFKVFRTEELDWIRQCLSSFKDGDKWHKRRQAFKVFCTEELDSIREDLSAPKYRYDQFRAWYKNRG